MLKISKLTDYGVVIMVLLARVSERVHSATEVAEATHIALPTVSKILKILATHDLVISTRGARGGYRLSRPPAGISIADVICAMEGPVSLTTCSTAGSECEQQSHCSMVNHWQWINRAVSEALNGLSLEDLLREPPTGSVQVEMLSAQAFKRSAAQPRPQPRYE